MAIAGRMNEKNVPIISKLCNIETALESLGECHLPKSFLSQNGISKRLLDLHGENFYFATLTVEACKNLRKDEEMDLHLDQAALAEDLMPGCPYSQDQATQPSKPETTEDDDDWPSYLDFAYDEDEEDEQQTDPVSPQERLYRMEFPPPPSSDDIQQDPSTPTLALEDMFHQFRCELASEGGNGLVWLEPGGWERRYINKYENRVNRLSRMANSYTSHRLLRMYDSYLHPHMIYHSMHTHEHAEDKSEALLLGELTTIIQTMLGRMKHERFYNNTVFPILMLSFHGTKARIIIAHFDTVTDLLVIECSELREFGPSAALQTRKDDRLLFLRWLLSTPRGDEGRPDGRVLTILRQDFGYTVAWDDDLRGEDRYYASQESSIQYGRDVEALA